MKGMWHDWFVFCGYCICSFNCACGLWTSALRLLPRFMSMHCIHVDKDGNPNFKEIKLLTRFPIMCEWMSVAQDEIQPAVL
jgi:hypothetical protein